MSAMAWKLNQGLKRDTINELLLNYNNPNNVTGEDGSSSKCYFCGCTNLSELSVSTCSSTSSGVSSDSSDDLNRWKKDPVAEKVTDWLKENPKFAKNYFVYNATRSWVESWKTFNSVHSTVRMSSPLEVETNSIGADRQSSSSGSNTPVRKISSHEFDMVGSRPIVSTNSDGTPTFLSPHASESNNLSSPTVRRNKRRRSAFKKDDEHEFLQELIKDLCDDLDITTLGFKILQNVSLLLDADRCSLFLIEEDRISGQEMLVSKLFDVTAESILEDVVKRCEENCIQIPLGHGIMGHVGQSGQFANIEDVYKDERFNVEIDKKTGYHTKCLLCMPLKDSFGNVLGVAQAVNKVNGSCCFTDKDVKVFQSYLSFCGMSVKNAQIYRQSQLETRRNQVLLELARMIFEEQSSLKRLIFKIMMHIQSLVQCERVQIIMIGDNGSKKENIFNRIYEYSKNESITEDQCESYIGNSHFALNYEIIESVALTGEIINITDAKNDARIKVSSENHPKEVPESQIDSLLCMPIKNANGSVLCVFQLKNKLRTSNVNFGLTSVSGCFTETDINLLEAFGMFCGLGIYNTQLYEEMSRAVAKQSITLDILSYHALAKLEDAERFTKMIIPSARFFALNKFTFTDFKMTDDDTIKGCIRMFYDLNLLTLFKIDELVLFRWLLSVRKNYREITYHNWRHAFNVAQTMFTMICTGHLNKLYSNLEILALLIACLCHDLDHRGTNNQFQVKTMSPMAQLYSTSVLEHHHFDQCVMILSIKGSDILSNLSCEYYQQVIELIEEAILATDLAIYFKKRNIFFDIMKETPEPSFWDANDNRTLLRCMCMTACDVAAITKPWESQLKIAELVASEFFEQGDLEKSKLNIKPIEMMDRDKKDELPRLQVEFIDQICLPLYKAMAKLSENLSPLLMGCLENRKNWEELWHINNKQKQSSDKSS